MLVPRAICVGWEGTTPRNFSADWLNLSYAPVNNTVSGSYLHHFGRVYKDSAGLWVGYTDSTTLHNNEIAYGAYSGDKLRLGMEL